jgi:hypothetical protein
VLGRPEAKSKACAGETAQEGSPARRFSTQRFRAGLKKSIAPTALKVRSVIGSYTLCRMETNGIYLH